MFSTFLELKKFYKWNLLSPKIKITDVKRFFENSTSLTLGLHRGSQNLKILIIWSKVKVVADLLSDWPLSEVKSQVGVSGHFKPLEMRLAGWQVKSPILAENNFGLLQNGEWTMRRKYNSSISRKIIF